MDSITKYYQIIYPILKEYADLPYRYGEVKRHLIVSEDKLHYLFLTWGGKMGEGYRKIWKAEYSVRKKAKPMASGYMPLPPTMVY